MSDIEFEKDKDRFKCRVCGIIIKDDKILAIEAKTLNWYYLPGGHTEIGEDSKEGLLREMQEELETKVHIEKLLAIIENFYEDDNDFNTHEISFYYLINPENYNNIKLYDYSRIENDKGILKTINFKWLEINKLKDLDFRPSCLKEKIASFNYDFEHVILKSLKTCN